MFTESNNLQTYKNSMELHKFSGAENLRIETINRAENLKKIRAEWDYFAEQNQNPLLSFDWFFSCTVSLCPTNELKVFVLHTNGSVTGIAPLHCINRFGTEQLEIPGTKDLMEPTSLLAQDDDSFEKIFNEILDLKKPLLLKRLILSSSLQNIIEKLAKKKSFFVIKNTTASQWLPIETSWEEFTKQMRSSQRSRLRRFRKRLEQNGTVEVEVHSEDSIRFRNAIDEAICIESSGWKANEGTSVLINKQLNSFFAAYISSALHAGILRLFLLKLNGKGIAMILGVEYAQCFWTLKIGYDERWSSFAPGIILHHESVKWAFEQKLKGYEFLGTVEPWIDTWTKNQHTYYTYRLFPKSIKGLLCLGADGMKFLSNRVSSLIKLILKKLE